MKEMTAGALNPESVKLRFFLFFDNL